jgi:phosphoenolpyruvate carboxykinase (ATP)
MQEFGQKSKKYDLHTLGIKVGEAHWNLSQAELIEESIKNREGQTLAP